jgi:hypothetical protein
VRRFPAAAAAGHPANRENPAAAGCRSENAPIALQQMAKWRELGLHVPIAVNISRDQLGVTLSLHDFGTDYSSLLRCSRCPSGS